MSGIFAFLTLVLGGAKARATGRAIWHAVAPAHFFRTVEQPVATLSEHPRFPTGTSPAAGAAQRPAMTSLARQGLAMRP